MLHEILGINFNKVDMGLQLQALNIVGEQQISEEQQKNLFVLSPETDEFFSSNIFVNFGELTDNLKLMIDRVTHQ